MSALVNLIDHYSVTFTLFNGSLVAVALTYLRACYGHAQSKMLASPGIHNNVL